MKRIITIFALCFAVAVAVQAQTMPNLILDVNEGKVVAQRTGYGTFTVEVLATTDNGVQRQLCYVTQPEQVLELTGKPTVHSVNWNWLQGAVDSSVDTAFVYQLPWNGCRKATVHALSNADLRIYRGNFRNFRVWQFDLKQGTKVYPVRAGEVIMVGENSVTVEHSDGSQAEYSVLNEAIKVVEGQQITTKTQLGTVGEQDGTTMVRVAVIYYVANTNEMYRMFSQTVYLDPLFKKGKLADGRRIRGN